MTSKQYSEIVTTVITCTTFSMVAILILFFCTYAPAHFALLYVRSSSMMDRVCAFTLFIEAAVALVASAFVLYWMWLFWKKLVLEIIRVGNRSQKEYHNRADDVAAS